MTELARFLGFAALLWALARCGGEERAPKVDFGFDAASVVPPAGRQKPIARVFAKYIYPSDLMADSAASDAAAISRLRGLILRDLLERFTEKSGIAATDEEVEQFNRAMARGGERAAAPKTESDASES